MCRSYIESIAFIDKNLHTEVVANIVVTTLETLQARGTSAVPWQQAELTMHLVYTFGELNKSEFQDLTELMEDNTRTAFYELPAEIATKAGRDRLHRISINKLHVESEIASGRTTPTSADGMSEDGLAEPIPGVCYGTSSKEKIDCQQYPLTILGQLLTLCMTSGIVAYPHPGVSLQYFETAVRYVEFWKSKPGSVQPIYEAMLDQR